MFNFEGLIPKICLLAQEMGDNEKVQQMRCAGIQALSSMVPYFSPLRMLMRIGFLIS